MPIKNEKVWKEYETKNTDPYGKCCVNVAREVMRLIDKRKGPIDADKLICKADNNIKAGGITGFMAGCVARMVSTCHSRGDEFNRSWNAMWGVKDAKRTVNPAVVKIGRKK